MARYYDRADYEEEPEEKLTFVQRIAKEAARKAKQVRAGATIDASVKAKKPIPIADREKYEQEVREPTVKTTAEPRMVATGGAGQLPLPTIEEDDKISPGEFARRRLERHGPQSPAPGPVVYTLTEEPRKGAMETIKSVVSQKAPNMQVMAEARNWREEMYRKMAEEQARKAAKKN